MTTKAKCPACGDEAGSEAKSLQEWADDGTSTSARTSRECLWTCNECKATHSIDEWLGAPAFEPAVTPMSEPEPTRLHPDDMETLIEGAARRVVELMKG